MKKQNWILEKLNLDRAFTALLDYLEIRLELFEIQIKEKTVMVLSSIVVMMLILSFGLFMLLFFSLAASMVINAFLGSSFLGFLAVGALYLLICVIIIVFKDKLIVSKFIKVFFEQSLKESEENKNDE